MPYRGRITEIGASHGSPFGPGPQELTGEAWAALDEGKAGLLYDGGIVGDQDDGQGMPLLSAAILGQDVPPLAYQIPEKIVGYAPKKSNGPATMPTDPKHYGPGLGGQAPQIATKLTSYIPGIAGTLPPIATKILPYQPTPWAPTPAFTLPLATPGAGPTAEEEAAAAQAAADAQEAEAKKGQIWLWLGGAALLWLLLRK